MPVDGYLGIPVASGRNYVGSDRPKCRPAQRPTLGLQIGGEEARLLKANLLQSKIRSSYWRIRMYSLCNIANIT